MSLKRTTTVTVKKNQYTVNFPTVGQLIEIETAKAVMSKNTYGAIMNSGTVASVVALDYVDAIAYFKVLIPDMMKDLQSATFEALDPIDAKEVVRAYKKQFLPWWVEWQKILNTVEEEKAEEPGPDESEKQ